MMSWLGLKGDKMDKQTIEQARKQTLVQQVLILKIKELVDGYLKEIAMNGKRDLIAGVSNCLQI